MEKTDDNVVTDSLMQSSEEVCIKNNKKTKRFLYIILVMLFVGICAVVITIIVRSHSHTVLTPEVIRNYCVEKGLIIQESGDGIHGNDDGVVYTLSCEENISDDELDKISNSTTFKNDIFLIHYSKYNKPAIETEMMSFYNSDELLVDNGSYKKYYGGYGIYFQNEVSYTVFDENTYLWFFAKSNKCAKDFLLGLGYPDDGWREDGEYLINNDVVVEDVSTVRRNSVRRDDLAGVVASLVQYQTNNRGALPVGPSYWKGTKEIECESGNTACALVKNYFAIDGEFMDPDGTPYSVYLTGNWATTGLYSSYGSKLSELVFSERSENASVTIGGESPFEEHVIYIIPGSSCKDGEGAAIKSANERSFSILYQLEGSAVYCASSV